MRRTNRYLLFNAGERISQYLILTSFFILAFGHEILAQHKNNITFERISTDMIRYEKGLSQNTVQCAIQDRYGFMWFGTWDGLNKYDGYTFTVWNEENGLSNQNIQAIVEDNEGLIWIGTEDGLNVYDRLHDQVQVFRHDHRDNHSLVHNRIRTLCVDKNGDIWIGTNRGISVFKKNQNRFINYKHDINNSSSLINNWINHIHCDIRGRIWIATYKGLELFAPESNGFIHFNKSTGWDTIAMLSVYRIAESKGDVLWIGSQSGLFGLNLRNNTVVHHFQQETYNDSSLDDLITSLMLDGRGSLWIGTAQNGVIVFDTETYEYIRIRNQYDDPLSLSNNQIYSLYEDDAGIIWIGSFTGINKYDPNSSKFRHHKKNPANPKSLLSDVIFAFMEDEDGVIWVGSENGINLFKPETASFELPKDEIGKPTRLVNGVVRAFYQDKEGMIWIGTSSGLVRYDPVTGNHKRYRSTRDISGSLANNFIRTITEDSKGNIWIGTDRGLSIFNKKSEAFTNYFHSENNPWSLPDNLIFQIHIDRRGRVWVATASGLCWFNPANQRFISFIDDMTTRLSANQRRFSSITETSDGTLWLGTFGGGILRFDPMSHRYSFYTENQGLPNNVVYKMIDDLNGNLWVPTNRGLARFNIANESFVTYTVKDGMQSNEFNLGASLRTRNGRILFGGMNGFNSFFPDEIRKNIKPPRIAISGFYIFERLIRRELFDGDTIHLKFSENFFAFNFTALDFANPAKNQYRYFLRNFDKGWINADAYDRLAIYTNVPPGKYTFRVKGSNNDGIWNDEGISITLIIAPPWYATWIFRGTILGSASLIIYIMVLSRIRRINRKHQIEKQFLEMEKQYFDLEQKALRLQMNPHFIFNTLNSIQSYMINNDPDKAIEYLAKFARLMRQVLTNSRESYIPVKEELLALKYYLEIEQLRFDDKFNYNIVVDKRIDEEFTGIPPMIIQPYVENAIIHGLMYKKEGGTVTITLEQRPDCIFCVIEDDGVGRVRALKLASESGLERKSTGMLITQQRLDILNQGDAGELMVNVVDKYSQDGAAAGTRLEIKMPFVEM